MSPIRAHLIDSVRKRDVFGSADFLIVAQAVEGFYCRFRKDGLSLNSIITKLREEFSDVSKVELSDDDIKCICDSRHYYSHLLPSGKKPNVKDGYALYILNHKLRKILLCCMLKYFGFKNEEINNIFNKSNNPYLRRVDG